MNEWLVRALLGIASCATRCACCRMHARIAKGVLKRYRESLSVDEAAALDRLPLITEDPSQG